MNQHDARCETTTEICALDETELASVTGGYDGWWTLYFASNPDGGWAPPWAYESHEGEGTGGGSSGEGGGDGDGAGSL